MSKFIVFRFKKDRRFTKGYDPKSFKYASDFYNTYEEAYQDCQGKQESNYVYGIETITRY